MPAEPAGSDRQRANEFAEEIRAYLIGRLGARPRTGSLDRSRRLGRRRPLLGSPVLAWWILEGQRYAGIDGPLCDHWPLLARKARVLLKAFSPRYRVVDMPDGQVDWVRTVQHRASSATDGYVCLASSVGLGPDERRALCGWAGWITRVWGDYCERVRTDRRLAEAHRLGRVARIGADPSATVERVQLRRWAHIARRSRWPLLRNVVAESLRSALDLERIDKLPLPGTTAELFELLCLVRVLRALEPEPTAIRWLSSTFDNKIVLPRLTCRFQHHVPAEQVLASSAFASQLAEAVEVYRTGGLPQRIDALVRFDPPRAGWDGIVLEAKSGDQHYGAALFQVHTYAHAVQQRWPGRWLVWAIVEGGAPTLTDAQLAHLRAEAGGAQQATVHAFSRADEIAAVVEAAQLT